MKIDRRLHVVIPIYGLDKDTPRLYVHSTPVDVDMWEKYWEPVSVAYARILEGGHGRIGGPRIADKMLRKVAEEMKIWDTPDGVKRGLLAEIARLTNVLVPGVKGWDTVPFDEANKRELIDHEDVTEIQAALCFFTLASLMHRREIRRNMLEGAMELWGAQISLSDFTEFMNSLPTSTASENSGATAAGS